MTDNSYNGWANYETWNISLWLQNEYSFWKLARKFDNYNRLIPHLENNFGQTTPDGVRWMNPSVNVEELNAMLSEM